MDQQLEYRFPKIRRGRYAKEEDENTDYQVVDDVELNEVLQATIPVDLYVATEPAISAEDILNGRNGGDIILDAVVVGLSRTIAVEAPDIDIVLSTPRKTRYLEDMPILLVYVPDDTKVSYSNYDFLHFHVVFQKWSDDPGISESVSYEVLQDVQVALEKGESDGTLIKNLKFFDNRISDVSLQEPTHVASEQSRMSTSTNQVQTSYAYRVPVIVAGYVLLSLNAIFVIGIVMLSRFRKKAIPLGY